MNVEIFECVLAPEDWNTVIREVPLVSSQIWEMGKFHLERCECKVHLCPQGQGTCSYLQEVRVGSQLNNSTRGASQVVLLVKILPADARDIRDEGSILGLGRSSWTEEPGRLQSIGSQRVGHDWVTELNWISKLLSNVTIVQISQWKVVFKVIYTKIIFKD